MQKHSNSRCHEQHAVRAGEGVWGVFTDAALLPLGSADSRGWVAGALGGLHPPWPLVLK